MRNIRVVHCIHSLSGGGAERQLKLLVEYLKDFGVDSAIFCADIEGADIRDQSIRIIQVPPESRYKWGFIQLLNDLLLEFKPDVIHMWLPASMTIPAIIAARWRAIPIIFSYRNKQYFNRCLSYLEFLLVSLFVRTIVTNNPVSQSNIFFRWLYKFKKGKYIPNAVFVDKKNIKKKCNVPIKGTPWKFLFAGRITYQKNLETLLNALGLLAANEWELTVCGDGENRFHEEQLSRKLSIDGKVDFKGYSGNLYEIMNKSDLLIIPSRFEGMPNVLLEALKIGLPCLVSDIFPHKHVLSENHYKPIFFNPESAEDLRCKIEWIINNSNSLKFFSDQGKIIAQSFHPSLMASKYSEFYRACKNIENLDNHNLDNHT